MNDLDWRSLCSSVLPAGSQVAQQDLHSLPSWLQLLTAVELCLSTGWTMPASGQETSMTSFTDQTGSMPVTSDCHSQQSLQVLPH